MHVHTHTSHPHAPPPSVPHAEPSLAAAAEGPMPRRRVRCASGGVCVCVSHHAMRHVPCGRWGRDVQISLLLSSALCSALPSVCRAVGPVVLAPLDGGRSVLGVLGRGAAGAAIEAQWTWSAVHRGRSVRDTPWYRHTDTPLLCLFHSTAPSLLRPCHCHTPFLAPSQRPAMLRRHSPQTRAYSRTKPITPPPPLPNPPDSAAQPANYPPSGCPAATGSPPSSTGSPPASPP